MLLDTKEEKIKLLKVLSCDMYMNYNVDYDYSSLLFLHC